MFPKTTLKRIIEQEVALSEEMITAIELWCDMMQGSAPWCEGPVKSLKLEQAIVREFADVCLNEMETNVSNEALDKLYQKAISELNEELQDGLGTGSFCIKPLSKDRIEFVTADKFIPIEFDAEKRPVKSVFIQSKRIDTNKYYIRFEFHLLDKSGLTIKNKAYKSFDGTSIGAQIELSDVDEWAKLPEEIKYSGMKQIDFGYFRVPLKNKVDGSACGMSIFQPALEQIKASDIQFARLDWEFESGDRAVFVDDTAINQHTKTVNKLDERLYHKLDQPDLFGVFSPEFREQSILNGFNAYLRRVEFNVGLAYGDISDVTAVEKTATETKVAKKRKYNRVKAIQNNLKDCLEEFVYALAFYNRQTTSGYDFICEFNDSILVDDETENKDMREDVAAGILKPEIYIQKRWRVSEEEAIEMMPEKETVPSSEGGNKYGIE